MTTSICINSCRYKPLNHQGFQTTAESAGETLRSFGTVKMNVRRYIRRADGSGTIVRKLGYFNECASR